MVLQQNEAASRKTVGVLTRVLIVRNPSGGKGIMGARTGGNTASDRVGVNKM